MKRKIIIIISIILLLIVSNFITFISTYNLMMYSAIPNYENDTQLYTIEFFDGNIYEYQ